MVLDDACYPRNNSVRAVFILSLPSCRVPGDFERTIPETKPY
jgi:hypothetical protein